MSRFLRQTIFLLYAFVLQWPFLLVIFLVGRFGLFKTLFLINPTDKKECLDFCPNIPWLLSFFSARPTPTGLIMQGFLPVGIYFMIPDTALELVRKKNKPMVNTIINRMLLFKKLSGAKTIGLAGQIGPVFEKQLKTIMEPPFFTSTYGNIYSIHRALDHLVKTSSLRAWQVSVAILGGGELGEQLINYLSDRGYRAKTIDVRFTRKGNVKLLDEQETDRQLKGSDYVINLLPKGQDFIDCRMQDRIPKKATIVDFSRPQIPAETIPQSVFMGNRIQRADTYFISKLPGGWQRHELPACSIPALTASLGKLKFNTIEEFRAAARQLSFTTALATKSSTKGLHISLAPPVSPLPSEM